MLTYAFVAGSLHGTLSGTAPNLFYTPATNFSGPDSPFQAHDGQPDSNVATVTITVTAVNDALVLAPIRPKSGDELGLLSFTIFATDVDLPANTLSYSASGRSALAAFSAFRQNV